MRRKEFLTRVLAATLSVSMVVAASSDLVLAATTDTYKDGTYTGTATVMPDEDFDFDAYEISVDVTVSDGKIESVAFSENNTYGTDEDAADENWPYINKAMTKGKGETAGLANQIVTNNGLLNDEGKEVDAVSTATCTSKAIIEAVGKALEMAGIEEDDSSESEDASTSEEAATTETQEETTTTTEEEETTTAAPEDTKTEAPEEDTKETSAYVLMNIPYDEFYAGEGVDGVDAVTTATVKTYNMGKAAGSYHDGYNAPENISDAKILGVTYPVYVEDMSVLSGLTKITDDSAATITVASGKSALTTKDVTGTDVLFASGDYAYYVMSGEPSSYKTLTVNEDGSFSFSAAPAKPTKGTATVEVKYACNYTDIEFVVEADEVANASAASAIILTTSDGEKYALQHVVNEWDRTDLGWNWTDLDGNGLGGKTITNVTYYLKNADGTYGIYSYDVDVTMKENPGTVTAAFKDADTITLTGLPSDIENAKATVKTKVGRGETATVIAENVEVENGTITTTEKAVDGTYVITITSDNYGDISVNADVITEPVYVLMNIPYAKFYAAENVDNKEGVDTVTSATVKTYNTGKAAGSYHAGYTTNDASNAEILGVTYPVYVESLFDLVGYTQVTDNSAATITVASGKSGLTTKDVAGADVLFASGDYAYYVMSGEPANYKTMTVNEDGTFSFSAVVGEVTTGTATVEVKYACNYTNIEFVVDAEELTTDKAACAIILTTSENERYALQHVVNEWDRTDLGWNWDDLDGNGLSGKTIKNVTYYLKNADGTYSIMSYDVDVTMKENPGTVTATFEDADTITMTGLPSDIKNAKATVKTKVGRGETATVIAENVAVVDGKIVTTVAAEEGTYVITVVSDNYGDISVNADYAKAEDNNSDKDDANKDDADNKDDSDNNNTNNNDNSNNESNNNDSNSNTNQNDTQTGTNAETNTNTETSTSPETDEEESDDTEDTEATTSPKTGDPASVMGMLGMMLASGAIGVGTFGRRKEEEE